MSHLLPPHVLLLLGSDQVCLGEAFERGYFSRFLVFHHYHLSERSGSQSSLDLKVLKYNLIHVSCDEEYETALV